MSGADISQFDKHRGSAEAREEYARLTRVGRDRLHTFAKPMIAKIDGYCIGGGLAIAMRADLRIASEGSSFGIPAARLGIACIHIELAVDDRLYVVDGSSWRLFWDTEWDDEPWVSQIDRNRLGG